MSTERINAGRQHELDVAKVLAILYMVVIHVYEEMGTVPWWTPPDSLFRIVMEFLGGPLAAPVFMFAMGVGMVYTKCRNPRAFAKRGLRLLVASYLLNVVRMTVPFYLARLAGDSWGGWTVVDTIGLVDILQFAGMAFLLMALLEKCRVGRWGIVAVALVLQAAGILLLHRFDGLPPVAQYIAGLLFHTNSNVCFPLTLWFVYPAFGVLFGEYLLDVRDKKKMYGRIAMVSAAVFVALCVGMRHMGWDLRNNFALAGDVYYVQHFPTTVWTLSVIGLQLFLCHRLALVLGERLLAWTEWVARRLNTIYLIQWIIIPYGMLLLAVAGVPGVPAPAIVPVGFLVAALSVFCARFVRIKL